jgi:hypothetical protein
MILPPDWRKVLAVWKNWGQEKFEVDRPMTMRIEPIDPQNPQTVAVLFGSLVLFAIIDTQPLLARADLLAAKRMVQRSWQVNTAGAPIKILPFTNIGEEQYSTYIHLT